MEEWSRKMKRRHNLYFMNSREKYALFTGNFSAKIDCLKSIANASNFF